MRIHREGFKILIVAFILLATICTLSKVFLTTIAFIIAVALSLPFYVFLLRFFRVPKRVVQLQPNKVLSPCDGKIVTIEEVDEPEFLKKRCIQVSVFMSVWNVHINWYPVAGKVAYSKYHPGKFLMAWEPKSSTLNERTTVTVERPDGVKVLFRQIAGFLARRIICKAKTDDQAEQGQEMGFIKFGSRVDVFLPLDANIKVELNQKVTGTQTVLAVLPTQKDQ